MNDINNVKLIVDQIKKDNFQMEQDLRKTNMNFDQLKLDFKTENTLLT